MSSRVVLVVLFLYQVQLISWYLNHFPAPRNPAEMEVLRYINGRYQYYIQINYIHILAAIRLVCRFATWRIKQPLCGSMRIFGASCLAGTMIFKFLMEIGLNTLFNNVKIMITSSFDDE